MYIAKETFSSGSTCECTLLTKQEAHHKLNTVGIYVVCGTKTYCIYIGCIILYVIMYTGTVPQLGSMHLIIVMSFRVHI